MTAYVFPGQGSQYKGMGLDLYESAPIAKDLFNEANDILKFSITKIMFEGSDEELRQTKVTQPAIFLHSVILSKAIGVNFRPSMVAGHSLGEFSALVANGVLPFECGLELVYARAMAMQEACEKTKGGMAAILGLEAEKVEEACNTVSGIVVVANYNCPNQVVISGELDALNKACEILKNYARKVLILPVGGAFHSPLMEPAREKLATAIEETIFYKPSCPIYQNVTALPVSNPDQIKKNLILQLTSPVKWTQNIRQMIADGANRFLEVGPGKVLQGLIRKVNPKKEVQSAQLNLSCER